MRLRSGSFWTLIALLLTATAYAEPPSSEVSKLLVQGGKERAEVVIDGSFEVPVYEVDPLDDGKRVVLDGPFAESKELVGGFYVIDVKSLEEAVQWALRCPTGLGTDDELTIHQLTEASDIPAEMLKLTQEAAPTWSATWVKAK
jgi:hypothetical protein